MTAGRLTQQYLSAETRKVVFRPQSDEETQFIVKQMAQMGFRIYSDHQQSRIPLAAKGNTLYLDTDKTLMVGEPNVSGVEASATEFETPYFYAGMPVVARLGAAELRNGVYAFFPRTMSEASGVITKLRAAGVALPEDVTDPSQAAMRALTHGLVVREGRMGTPLDPADLVGARISTAADLGLSIQSGLSSEQITIMAAFNEMSARLQQIIARMEQTDARLQKLEDEILPKPLDKTKTPALKIP